MNPRQNISGNEVHPPSESNADTDSTAGGNFITVGKSANLHHEWDTILASLDKKADTLVSEAKAAPPIKRLRFD